MTAVHWWRCPRCGFITSTCRTEKAAAAARDAHLGTAEIRPPSQPRSSTTLSKKEVNL